MNQYKIQTNKDKAEFNVAIDIVNVEELQNKILTAKTSDELIAGTVEYIELNKQFTEIEKATKKTIEEANAKSKLVKQKLADIEKQLKEVALKNIVTETKNKVNKETGEITEKVTHDLNTKLFSYTKGKKTAVVNTTAILDDPKKYGKFVKEVITYEVDFDAIHSANPSDIPWTDKTTKDKISVKKTLKPEDKEKLLETIKGIEL